MEKKSQNKMMQAENDRYENHSPSGRREQTQ